MVETIKNFGGDEACGCDLKEVAEKIVYWSCLNRDEQVLFLGACGNTNVGHCPGVLVNESGTQQTCSGLKESPIVPTKSLKGNHGNYRP